MQRTDVSSLMDPLLAIVQEAAAAIMHYHLRVGTVTHKSDHSPLTEADLASHAILTQGLAHIAPAIPVISEEDEALKSSAERYWLVDPLDGTRNFVRGGNDFSINIGLVENGEAVFGVIAMPVSGDVYIGERGRGASKTAQGIHTAIHVRAVPARGMVVVKSATTPSAHMQQFLDGLPLVDAVQGISSAVKFCLIAEGKADIYPRFGRTMEWDTAAGQAIVEAAGGRVTTEDGRPLTYGKPRFENGAFIARGRQA